VNAILGFGKHKGARVSEVDSNYLNWCLVNVTTLTRDLRQAITDELRKRGELVDGGDPAEEPDEPGFAAPAEPTEPTEPVAPPVQADAELRAALLDLRSAVVGLTHVSTDLVGAMTRMSNTLDRIERAHFERKPEGKHWTDRVAPTEAGAALAAGEPF
jgi:hypothetical protein